MALKVEGIVNGGMHAGQALGRSGRFEASHFTLAPSNNLMGIFRPIVLSKCLNLNRNSCIVRLILV
jgi:hypothetical protein